MRHFTRAATALLAALALALTTLGAQAADRRSSPAVRLLTPDRTVTMTVNHFVTPEGDPIDSWVELDPAIYLAARSHGLTFDVRRTSVRKPITATVTAGGHTRKVPSTLLDGWSGLKDAFTVTWSTASGQRISRERVSWCPNDGTPSRLRPRATTETRFTYGCSVHPFTRSHRWGIDKGWARRVLQYGVPAPSDDHGDELVLEVSLRWALAKVLGLGADQRSVRFQVTVKHVTQVIDDCEEDCEETGPEPVAPTPGAGTGPTSASSRTAHHPPATPTGTQGKRPPAGVLPDLVSLPAFGISTHTEDGRDLLDFAATVYNRGPGPLVAEGFRIGTRPLMRAYQFFYRDDKQVAVRKVGGMEYDVRPSHAHWHFQDFAVYDLVNKKKKRLRTSGKEAFCLAPTDAIDLLAKGAVVNPGNGDLATACGDGSSVWSRQVLAAGWGDTYTQARAGQSIDITGLPNGTYWIRITANPVHRLFEKTRRNNVSLRKVVLGGTLGERTVRVPRLGRIDSELGWSVGEGPVG